jgi:UDP-N-acetylglucosamine:LPS N-acetylglucosamine transferase
MATSHKGEMLAAEDRASRSPARSVPAPMPADDAAPRDQANPRLKVMLVCSSGGHLLQLYNLKPWWEQQDRTWVTFKMPDSMSLLGQEDVSWAYQPTTRNIPNMLRNLRLAWRLVRRQRPGVIVSSGAGVAFPFFLIGRIFRARTIYIEVYDRIDLPTLTGRLCYPFSDLFLLQWEQQRRFYKRGVVIGRLL